MIILTYCDAQESLAHFEGALWMILNAICYAVYTKSLNAIYSEKFDYAMFLGMIGVINVVMMVPIMIMLHVWHIEPFIMPPIAKFSKEMGYAFLCTGLFEFCWAKTATLLGSIVSTVGFTAVMLPTCLVMDFVLWPDVNRTLSERYIGGLTLVTLSFLVIGLVNDKTEVEKYILTKQGIVRQDEATINDERPFLVEVE